MSEINNISQLLDGNNPHKQLLEQTRQLVDKWEPTGLLEGIEQETSSTEPSTSSDEEGSSYSEGVRMSVFPYNCNFRTVNLPDYEIAWLRIN